MAGDDSIIVLGAGGHAKVVISTLRAAGYSIERLLDDDPSRQGVPVLGVPVSGLLSDIAKFPGCNAVIAIGDNHHRRHVAAQCGNVQWATVVHPTAIIDPTAAIGPGTVVFAGAIIQPDTIIGRHAIINTGATIDHDCRIGDYAHIAPGCHLCGNVVVGESTLLGVGSVVIPGKTIGARSVVGAGSVVVKDIPQGIVAAGVPARPVTTVD
jgi:sugar O-acyltransferase (sialic acid O-acetyltransferase NeuD family)